MPKPPLIVGELGVARNRISEPLSFGVSIITIHSRIFPNTKRVVLIETILDGQRGRGYNQRMIIKWLGLAIFPISFPYAFPRAPLGD